MSGRAVFKYVLPLYDEQIVQMPDDAELLHVANQGGEVTLWARVNTGSTTANRSILIRGTGHPVGDDPYVGTAHIGSFVWHVFDGGQLWDD